MDSNDTQALLLNQVMNLVLTLVYLESNNLKINTEMSK